MFLNYLKGFAESSAMYSDDPSFESTHLEHVVLHSIHLCKKKNLDEKLVMAIALGHDLGRTHLNIHGKNHAKASSKLMKKLLRDSDFSEEEKKIICGAIEHHSEKNKIHDEYDELIKDADSLAHRDDGILAEGDEYEQSRIIANECDLLEMKFAPVSDWINVYAEHINKLKGTYLDFDKRSNHPDIWVHEIRTGIRKIRAILKLLAPTDIKIQKKLRKWAHEMSEARFLHVVTMKADHLSPKVNEKLNRLYKELDSKLTQKKIEKRIKYLDIKFDHVKIVSDTLARYERSIMDITPKNMHKLRVKGKAIKYLTQMDLMDLSPHEMVDSILKLHDLLGDYNDYMEMADFLKDSTYKDKAKKLMKPIQNEIFFIQKLILCCTTTKNVRYN